MNKKLVKYLMIFLALILAGCGRTDTAILEDVSTDTELPTSVSGDIQNSDTEQLRNTGRQTAQNETHVDDAGETDKSETAETDKSETAETDGSKTDRSVTINVYICGAVRHEGVYRVPADGIVNDALTQAGGYSSDAYHGYINLAAPVTEGMRIYFPTVDEVEEAIYSDTNQNSSSSTGGQGSDLNSDSMAGSSSSGSTGSNSTENKNGMININTAGRDELMKLPGIGESKAEDIIRYREEHGEFKSIDDIKNINGIKEGIFEKIRDLITI